MHYPGSCKGYSITWKKWSYGYDVTLLSNIWEVTWFVLLSLAFAQSLISVLYTEVTRIWEEGTFLFESGLCVRVNNLRLTPIYFAKLCLIKFSNKSQNSMKRTRKIANKSTGKEDESERTIIWQASDFPARHNRSGM